MSTCVRFVLSSVATLLAVVSQSVAAEPLDAVRAAILKVTPDVNIQQLTASPVPGLFHAMLDGSSGYVTADGRYFIPGDLFDVKSRSNVTEQDRKASRMAFLKKLDPKDVILFAPTQTKYTVTVFTDVDCGFCRKLHGEMAQYNELGIAVRYVAYPRSGPDSESWTTMNNVWCAADRKAALTRAKLGEKIESTPSCKQTPIAAQYQYGQDLGIQGTPMIVLEDGRSLGGYASPADLTKVLEGKKLSAQR